MSFLFCDDVCMKVTGIVLLKYSAVSVPVLPTSWEVYKTYGSIRPLVQRMDRSEL